MENVFDDKRFPVTSIASGKGIEITPDIYCFTTQIVNVFFIGNPHTGSWVLIDAGMPHAADNIIKEAESRFGKDARPEAIILTHGHFDHVGSIVQLLKKWDIPVFAHKDELPYLTGKASYPEPDPSVGSGLVAKMSPAFPNEGINIKEYVTELPIDHTIPHMDGWKWIHTPGHTKGHVSLFRAEDRALIAGDAFINVKQESLYKVVTQHEEISGPPQYLTTDWQAAWESVKKLNDLKAAFAGTGHGKPLTGEDLVKGLQTLTDQFDSIAIPEKGKFVK